MGLPLGAVLEDVLPPLRPVRVPPALSSWSTLRPVQVLPGEAGPAFSWKIHETSLFEIPVTAPTGLC